MPRTGYSSAADSESLQTDVMRFMAIIAFCLIAILALVRNVEPSAVKEPSADKEPSAAKEPSAVKEPSAPAEVQVPASPPEIPAEIPEVVEAPPLKALEPIRPLPEDQPLSRTPRKTKKINVALPETREKPRAATPEVPREVAAAPPAKAKEEEGLSLRFASDRDFMRLVAKGDIQVYALKAQDVLSLDRSFRFLESSAPDRIYELLPETIPSLMANALHSERTETEDYVWGIRMPDRLEQRIRAFIDKGATGQLIINRYGEVQHAAGV